MSSSKPLNIRVDDQMDALIASAAEKTGLPRADVMRHALGLGLRDLELIDFDILGAIHDRVQARKESCTVPMISSVQKDPPKKQQRAAKS
jgi:hypothetical protein